MQYQYERGMIVIEDGILSGKSFPLGATMTAGGVNFCVFSKNCRKIELLLFDDENALKPSRVIELDHDLNKTFYYWHIFIKGIGEGQLYGYRVYGDQNPSEGMRFDGTKVLVDPYANAVVSRQRYNRDDACRYGSNCHSAMLSVIVDRRRYDWGEDLHLNRPFAKSVIYELHVGSFTKNENSNVSFGKNGTYAGLIEKIPYLKELGITAVELMPIQQFDPFDAPVGKENWWGYSPVAFFAPHNGYSYRTDPLGPVDEFRDMVKALHQADIEVILDVVFNHTAEGDYNGPTLSFRGFENEAYYILDRNKALYADYSGCGNTVNSNYSIVRRLILDCLRYWVAEMHVDGFRFDLASVMSRDEWGVPLKSPPILWDIESDPVLAGTKIIAEAWDAGGLYQVGSFIGHKWAEWNGQFRDDVRKFIKGEEYTVGKLAARITGSRDIYTDPNREPNRSINFITCHDGFTLNDLVSYNEKHNLDNGEDNRDGTNDNFSWNCGVEGKTDDQYIEYLRLKQIKNFITILLISEGTPMLLMGDEIRRTKRGNNNTYCHNNELNWFDWSLVEKNKGLLEFVKKMIDFTKKHDIFNLEEFWEDKRSAHKPCLTWHGIHPWQPDWSGNSHILAFRLHYPETGILMYFMINSSWKDEYFQLFRTAHGYCWYKIIDTANDSPDDFVDLKIADAISDEKCLVRSRSIVMLMEAKEVN